MPVTLVSMKIFGPGDGPIHVALGCEVDDRVDLVLDEEPLDERAVADVPVHERVLRMILHVRQVLEIARVGQLVEVHDVDVGMLLDHHPDEIAPDEAGTSRDENAFHNCLRYCSSDSCQVLIGSSSRA